MRINLKKTTVNNEKDTKLIIGKAMSQMSIKEEPFFQPKLTVLIKCMKNEGHMPSRMTKITKMPIASFM